MLHNTGAIFYPFYFSQWWNCWGPTYAVRTTVVALCSPLQYLDQDTGTGDHSEGCIPLLVVQRAPYATYSGLFIPWDLSSAQQFNGFDRNVPVVALIYFTPPRDIVQGIYVAPTMYMLALCGERKKDEDGVRAFFPLPLNSGMPGELGGGGNKSAVWLIARNEFPNLCHMIYRSKPIVLPVILRWNLFFSSEVDLWVKGKNNVVKTPKKFFFFFKSYMYMYYRAIPYPFEETITDVWFRMRIYIYISMIFPRTWLYFLSLPLKEVME